MKSLKDRIMDIFFENPKDNVEKSSEKEEDLVHFCAKQVGYMIVFFLILLLVLVIIDVGMQKTVSNVNDVITMSEEEVARSFYKAADNFMFGPYMEIGDYKINIDYGEVCINDKPTGVKTGYRVFYDEVAEMYYSGKWDGEKTKYKGIDIEIDSTSGYLFTWVYDKHEFWNSDLHLYPIDVPIEDTSMLECSPEYVEGEGAYVIRGGKLKKYVRGKLIDLPGSDLSWTWKDSKDARFYLSYANYQGEDELYLYVKVPSRSEEKEMEYEYLIPDRNESYIELISKQEVDKVRLF